MRLAHCCAASKDLLRIQPKHYLAFSRRVLEILLMPGAENEPRLNANLTQELRGTIMSTTTVTFGQETTAATTEAAPRKSFYQRLIDSRTAQGQARVRAIFERMSDAQLADIGLTGEQARQVRATGRLPASYWS